MRQNFLIILFLHISSTCIYAQSFSDQFDFGSDTTYWNIFSNDTLYSYDDTHGDIRFLHRQGGSNSLRVIRMTFLPMVYGNFDVSIDFKDANIKRINGSPGNQVQLNLNFGDQGFAVVRSDEAVYNDNYHVWIDPPGQWRGDHTTTDTSGTMRVTRNASVVTGFFNNDTIFSGTFNNSPVQHLSFSLQNNKTTDSISVTFDNFVLIADSIENVITYIQKPALSVKSFSLSQNYPNPFNPLTTIQYQLPYACYVTLDIFNILGEHLVTLIDTYQQAGLYSVNYNAKTSAGIYFYRLQTDTYYKIKKMILVK